MKYTIKISIWEQLLYTLALFCLNLYVFIYTGIKALQVVTGILMVIYIAMFIKTLLGCWTMNEDKYTEEGRAFRFAVEQALSKKTTGERLSIMIAWKNLYGISEEKFRRRVCWEVALQDVWLAYCVPSKPQNPEQVAFLKAVQDFYSLGSAIVIGNQSNDGILDDTTKIN